MRGAEVRVTGTRTTTGRIVSVTSETASLPNDGGTVVRNRVSLMTAEGLQQIILEETDAVQFVDAALQAQLDEALAAIARHNTPDRRSLDVRVSGTGERTIRVGYVIEAPLWKTSYRLTMDGVQAADEAAMQGWAILENLSGEDWQDIDLTVAVGQSGHLPPGALRLLFRVPAGDPGRGAWPGPAAHRCRIDARAGPARPHGERGDRRPESISRSDPVRWRDVGQGTDGGHGAGGGGL